MAEIIYVYRANPSSLLAKYPKAKIVAEGTPLLEVGYHTQLEQYVSRKLKGPSRIIVKDFVELGDKLATIKRNIEIVTGHKHTLTVDSKNVTFESLEQFNEYFGEFLRILGKEDDDSKPARAGRPSVITDEMGDVIKQLRARKEPPSYDKIATILTKTFGVEVSREVCYGYMKRLGQVTPSQEDQD